MASKSALDQVWSNMKNNAQQWGNAFGITSNNPSTPSLMGSLTQLKNILSPAQPAQAKTMAPAVLGAQKSRAPTPTMNPLAPVQATPEELMQAIRQGTPENPNLPVATMAAQIINTGQKYPLFKHYPFLPIASSILESGGLKAFQTKPNQVYKPKQALGWGANLPDSTYNPDNVEQVFNDYMTALGGRTFAEGFTPTQIATSNTYAPLRETGDLKFLGNTYAPSSDNGENGGDVYAARLQWLMDNYMKILQDIQSKKKNK